MTTPHKSSLSDSERLHLLQGRSIHVEQSPGREGDSERVLYFGRTDNFVEKFVFVPLKRIVCVVHGVIAGVCLQRR